MNVPSDPFRYLLAFGSNLGNRRANCQKGLEFLARCVRILNSSPWIVTPPLKSNLYDTTGQEEYLNFIIDATSHLYPDQLYESIKAIEDVVGHSREGKWLPRHLDIDVLFWAKNDHNDFSMCQLFTYFNPHSGLKIPHSDFWSREFLCKLVLDDLNISEQALRAHAQPSPAI